MGFDKEDIAFSIGLIGLILLILAIILLPILATIILGIAIANMLGFTGIVWWSFLIIFYIIIMGIIGALGKLIK